MSFASGSLRAGDSAAQLNSMLDSPKIMTEMERLYPHKPQNTIEDMGALGAGTPSGAQALVAEGASFQTRCWKLRACSMCGSFHSFQCLPRLIGEGHLA